MLGPIINRVAEDRRSALTKGPWNIMVSLHERHHPVTLRLVAVPNRATTRFL